MEGIRRKGKTQALSLVAALGLACSTLAQSSPLPAPVSKPYTWSNAVVAGGGFVTGIITHPTQKDLMYARTDVGGAYRWDAPAHHWVPLTDWIGLEDVNLTGIESIAVDPNAPERLYLAAGTYTRAPAAILRSQDFGRTFRRTDVPFRMGANEAGRFNGERLAVDPNQPRILFFGSRKDGLWKSSDFAATWQRVGSFPNLGGEPTAPASGDATNSRRSFRFGQQPVGIVCVLFDAASGRRGRPTPVVYAAVSTTLTNLYRSADAGRTWQPVANQPVGLRPNHMVLGPDGILYLTCGKEPGPNTMTDGAVWRYSTKDGVWTDITPLKPAAVGQHFGYGALAVDAQHPATVMVATFAHWEPQDEVFRSTNGGKTWQPLLQQAEWDHSSAPYTQTRTPHWLGDLEINPANADQVLFTTGYGVWCCTNATAADTARPTHWVFLDDGLEETVPLGLLSPPVGAHLLSGLGDIDGFRHEDLNASPPQGSFAGPRFSNTEDLACAANNPQLIVRVGTARTNMVRAALSDDGGKQWRALASEPANSGGAGTVTISADGNTIVWTPRRCAPHFTHDRGVSWTPCSGLSPRVRVVADPVDASCFYAFDTQAGRVLASTNGAASFQPTTAALPPEESAGGFGFGGGSAEPLSVTPGLAGDLWLSLREGGLLHSTNAGASFAKVPAVEEVQAIGFGKAARSSASPALYLAGKVAHIRGLFRSDDTGQTWLRLNDDQHQFGWIGRVTGDPRVFGRVYLATGGRGIIYGDPIAARDLLATAGVRSNPSAMQDPPARLSSRKPASHSSHETSRPEAD